MGRRRKQHGEPVVQQRPSRSSAAEAPAVRGAAGANAKPASMGVLGGQRVGLAGATKLNFVAAACFIVVLVCMTYANSTGNGFVWDDHEQIAMNPQLRSSASLGRLFSSDVWSFSSGSNPDKPISLYYRPLQIVTYRLVAETAGANPVAFHLLSIVFLCAAAILALIVFWQLTSRMAIAVAAAALFAVHPTHSEAVDWASALPDVGCTVFVLAASLCFLLASGRASNEGEPHAPSRSRRILAWVLSVACFGAALLWKETAAVFPLLIAAYVLFIGTEVAVSARWKLAARLSLPFWLALGGYLFVRFRVVGLTAMSQRNWLLSPLQVVLTDCHLLMKYWWKLIAPFPLNAYQVFSPVTSLWSVRGMGGLLFVTLAGAAIVYGARRRPLLSFAALWVFITLLPVMNIYAVGRNVFAERYLFLPSVGFCLFVAAAAVEAGKWIPGRSRKTVGISVLAVVVALFAIETIERNPDWKDDATLFARTLERSPNAPFVQNMVAATEKENGDEGRSAEAHYLQALALAASERPPDRLQMTRACEGLASIYSDRSDFAHAIEYLKRVRSIDPKDPEVDGEEGLILTRAGRWDEATIYLRKALAASPENENVLNALGIFAQEHTHRLDEAAQYFLRALAVHTARDSFSASLHNNLGAVYGEQGQYTAAIEQLRLAVELSPDDPEYHTNLATAYAASARLEEARAEIRAALAIAPDYAPARDVLRQLEADRK